MKRLMCLLVMGFWQVESLLAQCSSCKAAAASTDEAGKLIVGGGINVGVLFLLALPFIGFGTILGIWYFKQKEKNNDEL